MIGRPRSRARRPAATGEPPHPLRLLVARWRRDGGRAWKARRDPLGKGYRDGERATTHRLCRDHALELETILDELEVT